ncbi:MBL fold metallo-hydrolase [Mycolicibacterium frederiksbergense]|uniref:MBL fold metallo-hydrolase n=1 Tax=Mycolicibacterium frederiksbergense TaxID=117567 RepID=UPI00399B3869
MLITGFPAGVLACNCYVLAPHAGADAVIVDPGQSAFGRLRAILDENRLTPAAVLLTHGHIDHMWSAQKVADTYGCPVYIHPQDRAMLTDPIMDLNAAGRAQSLVLGFGKRAVSVFFSEPRQVVELVEDGMQLDLGGIAVTVDHTPGHTPGSVCFRVDGMAFTGDTLFQGAIGRSDLLGGSGRQLLTSIVTKLLVLDDDTVVLPGHGEKSTIGIERRTNPFLEGLTL